MGGVTVPVDLIRTLSPASHSIMEFGSELDIHIKKMTRVPLLGEYIVGVWNLFFSREFHMTDDSGLFKTKPDKEDLTLYEGRMIWHFEHSIGTLMKESGHCLTKPIIATSAVLAPPTLTKRVIYPWWLKSLDHCDTGI